MNMLEELGTIVLDTHHLGSFTDEEFYNFCLDNHSLKFERDSQGNIYIISNTGGKTGVLNSEFTTELTLWNRKHKLGHCFDSSTAFKLPTGAVRSPDAAWVSKEKWSVLTEKEKTQFPPICPEFVVEIKSHNDQMELLTSKMNEYIAAGVKLAWLIDPEKKETTIFEPNKISITLSFEQKLSANPVLPTFEVVLAQIF